MTEPKNSILASSLDNYFVFDNAESQEQPYVVFNITNYGGNIDITIEDENNNDGLRYVLRGNDNDNGDFNTSTSIESMRYSLITALEKCPIFFNIRLVGANQIRCLIDTSIKYKITSSNGLKLAIGGSYVTYRVGSLPKFRLEVTPMNQSTFTLEKRTSNPQVSFNITSPFQYMMSKYPIDIDVKAYKLGSSNSTISLSHNSLTIMPTTMSKFNEIDYSDYLYSSSRKGLARFLTLNSEKTTNYNEVHALSLLSDEEDISIRKKYYTNGGVYLTTEDGYLKKEYNSKRIDYYFDFNILSVERNYNREVGYIEVVGIRNNVEVVKKITYTVYPNCNDARTLFFLNQIGGVESFTFYGERKVTSKIKSQTTIPKGNYDEFVHSKNVENITTLTSNNIDTASANWLKDLQKSKCVWLMAEDTFEITNIIIDKFDISISNKEKKHTLTLDYHISDDKINY